MAQEPLTPNLGLPKLAVAPSNSLTDTGFDAAQVATAPMGGRLEVVIPEETFEAGKRSVLRIIIRNPFNHSVDIKSIVAPRSSHISSVGSESHAPSSGGTTSVGRSSTWRNFLSAVSSVVVSNVSIAGVSASFGEPERQLHIKAEKGSSVAFEEASDSYKRIYVEADENARVTVGAKPVTASSPGDRDPLLITIGPNCESVAYLNIETNGWLLFKPSRLTLSTQISYRLDDHDRSQVASTTFDVKPPLSSMAIGATIGAILGTLAKVLNTGLTDRTRIGVTAAASVVMSIIATVSLSRKTGSQGFITVEDFFGGFVLGTLIGYSGTSYFEQSLLPKQSPSLPR